VRTSVTWTVVEPTSSDSGAAVGLGHPDWATAGPSSRTRRRKWICEHAVTSSGSAPTLHGLEQHPSHTYSTWLAQILTPALPVKESEREQHCKLYKSPTPPGGYLVLSRQRDRSLTVDNK
jgi:hypothetical protein